MAEKREWELKRGQYLGDISALCFLQLPRHLSSLPYLLSGTGSQILVYDLVTANVIKSFQVFEGVRVHGISCTFINCTEGSSSSDLDYKIAVFGERRVKLFCLHIEIATNMQIQPHLCMDLILFHSLPKFSHWVLDVCFLKDGTSAFPEGRHWLAIGCGDNSVHFWDIMRSLGFEVNSPDRCLLYSMRIWGEKIEGLYIASGTIFNEIIIWKVVYQNSAPCLNSHIEDQLNLTSSFSNGLQLHIQQYEAISVCRLAGHEGSIFQIAWASNGSKLVSVSDDRSARIWEVHAEKEGLDIPHSVGLALFGHSARVWDCYIFDDLIITVGEDCTCRVWGLDGTQLKMIKEHIGRGVWRCLYDPTSSLLVTAGFDSAVKVHHLHATKSNDSEKSVEVVEEFTDGNKKEIFTLCIPNSSGLIAHMDSKSEYVRCLRFTREDTLYVATNNGFLYHARIFETGDVKWTELLGAHEQAPIVCMDLLSRDTSGPSSIEDWVAVGDGKGNMKIIDVVGDVCGPKVGPTFTWAAELERQLLGTFWCKSAGYRFIFTADPRGTLKLWRLHEPLQSVSHNYTRSGAVSLIAKFVSCFAMRIMCLDVSLEAEVLTCGDLRGNLVLFPLTKELLLHTPSMASESKIYPSNYFKGAHGISSVCRVLIASSGSSQVDICSAGGDGCICYLEYDRDREKLEFMGMTQVKELSMVQSFFHNPNLHDNLASGNYAIGFTSTDFIIWNLVTETKVVQIPCGGWRRPNSYFIGDIPELKNCFAFVKDEIIYIHRYWVPDSERKIYPQNLHLQFHGREIHSLCFISQGSRFCSKEKRGHFPNSCWIATGCEDGTVRLTRHGPGVENWTSSKLLGEHVGGSAVRSVCCVSKTHIFAADLTKIPNGLITSEDGEDPFLLISVGAKRVLTAWKQKFRLKNNMEEALCNNGPHNSSSGVSSWMMSFQWLSTDMPTKTCSSTREKINNMENVDSTAWLRDKYENDWRYLAVTAFLVKVDNSRISVCFIVVACSDATLALRALILPYRLWYDIALLVPLASPVLALQHIVIPERLALDGKSQIGSQYIVVSGSTDGSITFWDLTKNVKIFMGQVSALQMEDNVDCQKRPRTGRGSQGGRWWRSLGRYESKKKPCDISVSVGPTEKPDNNFQSPQCISGPSLGPEVSTEGSSLETCEILALHALDNVHQSGVNCLHVSKVNCWGGSDSDDFLFYVISGGDDQALHCLRFDVSLLQSMQYPRNLTESEASKLSIRFSHHEKILSAHGSAVKGVWTDGSWVFSTGLDQRVRCWQLEESGKLTERAHLIVSVPEPEALDARACDRNHYQIAVAGRGMQMVEFVAPGGMDKKDS